MPNKNALTSCEKAKKLNQPPPRISPIKLNSLQNVREELSRVYREARLGVINPSDATRLAYLLGEIRRLIVDLDLEQRLGALETEIQNRSTTNVPRGGG